MRITECICIAWGTAALFPWPVLASSPICPLPTCLLCVSASRILSPAFGVHLSESYAASAVRFHNGSVAALSKVDTTELGHLIERFEQSNFQIHDGQTVLGRSSVAPTPSDLSQATADVFIRLREATLLQHGFDMKQILLSMFPMQSRFQGHNIAREAAQIAGLGLIADSLSGMTPDPVGAAAAANGIGLCSNFTKLYVCNSEENRLPESLVLGVDYSSMSLRVTMSPFQASRFGFEFDFDRHWDLGSTQSSRDALYWSRVKEAIMKVPRVWQGRRITDVVLMGESATDDDFLSTLRDVLWQLFPDAASDTHQQPLTSHFVNPTFAAAIGAAEIAKRVLEAPDGCLERSYCDWWRRVIG